MRKKILYAALLLAAGLAPAAVPLTAPGSGPVAQASTVPPPVVDLPWRDDFNSLDAASWRAVDRADDCYSAANATTSRGKLHLAITPGRTTACPTMGVRYNTYGRKDFGPGTMSARIRFATAPGSWQTFWLTGASGREFPSNGEMDVAEIVGREPTLTHDALHSSFLTGGPKRCDQGSKQDFPVDRQWHVYSVTWSSRSVVFRIDGQVRSTYVPNGVCEFPFGDRMRVQLSARTGKYGGATDMTRYPLSYDVDWITYAPLVVKQG